MIDVLGALRRDDFEAAAELLDPDVSWEGLREEVVDTSRWPEPEANEELLLYVYGTPPERRAARSSTP